MRENDPTQRSPATLEEEHPPCFGIPEMVCPRDNEGIIQPQPECLQCQVLKVCLRKAVEEQGLLREASLASPVASKITGFLKRWSERKRHGGGSQ